MKNYCFVNIAFISILLLQLLTPYASATDFQKISDALDQVAELGLTPGLAIAVTNQNKTIFSQTNGYANLDQQMKLAQDNLFYIASTTKSFTGLAASMLNKADKLPLSQSVAHFLPEFVLPEGLDPKDITLQDLLTCTHGINEGPIVMRTAYTGDYDNDKLIEIAKWHTPLKTGKQFDYSNLGFNIYGIIMDKTLGLDWKEYINKNIFAPIGMKSTFSNVSDIDRTKLALPYQISAHGFAEVPFAKVNKTMHAAGGHLSTVEDLSIWLRLQLNLGKVNGQQVIAKYTIQLAHDELVQQNRKLGNIQRYAWGLGWDIGNYRGQKLVHRPGSHSGYFSHVSFMPDRNIGVVVLTNGGWFSYELNTLVAEFLYDSLLEEADALIKFKSAVDKLQIKAAQIRKHMKVKSNSTPSIPVAIMTNYIGDYFNQGYGKMNFYIDKKKLMVRMGVLKSEVILRDIDKHVFRVTLLGKGSFIQFQTLEKSIVGLKFDGARYSRQ